MSIKSLILSQYCIIKSAVKQMFSLDTEKNLTSKENIIPRTVLSEAKTSTDINTS